MKRLLIFISVFALMGCETASEQRQVVWKHILDGNCTSAESYAMQNYTGEYLYWWYGTIQQHCRKNRSKAIEYFKAGARANSEYSNLSVKALIELGEKPPEPTTRYITVPVQRQPQPQPQQIIIQQQPMNNPNACIQDGGGIYCPNYRR
ncbi:hypothetical protein [Limnohabitans sp. 2KL-1]|uniref:hypothetical protein n=1 Tax=Limnohabitans sp. 2KL-1 TaxID=1100699 RepID=UPI0011B299D4|nr:hypothetical protein [Limnohabitans sp. 2KL-1]